MPSVRRNSVNGCRMKGGLRARVGFFEQRDGVFELGTRDGERTDEPVAAGERLEVRRQAQES